MSSRITRRDLVLGLLAWPLAAPATPPALTAGLRRWGRGEMRRFGLLIYEATLWTGGADPARPPLALELTYRRSIAGRLLAQASVQEMQRLAGDEDRLQDWGAQLARIFPDVEPGDRITGLHLPSGARFTHNNQEIGRIDDTAFAEAFFGIWLSPRTSAPDLRAALLRPPAAS